MADSIRLIKKYPNRRLYDTQTSAYITLADVKELVLKRMKMVIVVKRKRVNMVILTIRWIF